MPHEKSLVLGIAAWLFISGSVFGQKKRAWQTGKLINFESVDAGRVVVPIGGLLVAKDRKVLVYFISTETTEYQFGWSSPEPLNLTVNTTIKFAIEKNIVYILDEDGKERVWLP